MKRKTISIILALALWLSLAFPVLAQSPQTQSFDVKYDSFSLTNVTNAQSATANYYDEVVEAFTVIYAAQPVTLTWPSGAWVGVGDPVVYGSYSGLADGINSDNIMSSFNEYDHFAENPSWPRSFRNVVFEGREYIPLPFASGGLINWVDFEEDIGGNSGTYENIASGSTQTLGEGVHFVQGGGPGTGWATFIIIVGDLTTDPATPVTPTPAPTPTITVNPTPSTVYVNGVVTAFEAYNIEGNNYFKLRDLAYALNGTNKQFSVGYDNATRAITLTSGQPYTEDGGEMAQGDGSAKSATLNTTINISKDGVPVEITAYLIDGNNFMRLRDVMELLDVGVGYDNTTRNITIDTSLPYTED